MQTREKRDLAFIIATIVWGIILGNLIDKNGTWGKIFGYVVLAWPILATGFIIRDTFDDK